MFKKRFPKLDTSAGEAACGKRPNCVCSVCAPTNSHYIEPLQDIGADPIATLADVIRNMQRSRMITEDKDYLHAEFRSALIGFVDDVEFLVDGEAIHVRSASRVGYGDHDVNRKRVEEIYRQVRLKDQS